MVNVFGDSIASGPGNLQVVKKVAKFKDYIDELQQSYELGFTPYSLRKKVLLERLVKWDLLENMVELEHVVIKVTRETLVVLVNKDL